MEASRVRVGFCNFGCRVAGLLLRIDTAGLRIFQRSECRVQGRGFRRQGLGFRVWGLGV